MDYKKLKKDELVALLEKNEEIVSKAKEYKEEYDEAVKTRQKAIEETFKYKKELERIRKADNPEIVKLKTENRMLEEELSSYKNLKEQNEEANEKIKFLEDTIKGLEKQREIEANRIDAELKNQEKNRQDLIKDFKKQTENYNQLASLFDEYIVAFDDQYHLYKVMQRNTENTLALLKAKIKNFNKQGDEIK